MANKHPLRVCSFFENFRTLRTFIRTLFINFGSLVLEVQVQSPSTFSYCPVFSPVYPYSCVFLLKFSNPPRFLEISLLSLFILTPRDLRVRPWILNGDLNGFENHPQTIHQADMFQGPSSNFENEL